MLDICPVSLKEANAYVEQHHRHHKPVVGHKFSIGCTDGENIVGVAIVGRPVSRYLDDGWTLEVNRLATDGTIIASESIWYWNEIECYGLYSEEADDWFIPEGWWEYRQFNDDDVCNNIIDCAVTHWMSLPEPPEEVLP